MSKVNKRQYVNTVVGTEVVSLGADAYKLECIVIPYPDATTKTAIPFTVDLGYLSYAVGNGTYLLSYGGNSDYRFVLNATVTAYTRNVSLNNVTWSGTDITSTAKLVVASVS